MPVEPMFASPHLTWSMSLARVRMTLTSTPTAADKPLLYCCAGNPGFSQLGEDNARDSSVISKTEALRFAVALWRVIYASTTRKRSV